MLFLYLPKFLAFGYLVSWWSRDGMMNLGNKATPLNHPRRIEGADGVTPNASYGGYSVLSPFSQNEKDIYPLSLLKHFSTVGINEGSITGLLIPPHQIPDRRLKPVVVPKCKR